MKHKHAELIKAWADGSNIEQKYINRSGEYQWEDVVNPIWHKNCEYRIKADPYAEIKAAYAAGKTIQVQSAFDGGWTDLSWKPEWNSGLENYRIKAEVEQNGAG